MTPTPDDLGLFERLIRIETKLDVANTSGADHETRLRALEARVWRASGVAAGIGLLGAYVIPQLVKG